MRSALNARASRQIRAAASDTARRPVSTHLENGPRYTTGSVKSFASIASAPRVVAQRRQMQAAFGRAIQRMPRPEEKPLQGRLAIAQRQATPEEDELVQGKFPPLQRKGLEEEEPLQGKFALQLENGDEDEDAEESSSDWLAKANRFLKTYRLVHLPLQTTEKEQFGSVWDYVDMALTGPITGAYARTAELAVDLQAQDLKALVPWSHKRKNWMRFASATEGATDVAWNTATLATDTLSLGAASTGTAAIGAGYKTGFSVAKSRIRRESKRRAATRAGAVAVSEFGQGVIPFAGSAWGIGSGVKQLGQTLSLDMIAPERRGLESVVELLDDRIQQCQALMDEAPLAAQFEESALSLGRAGRRRARGRSQEESAGMQLQQALTWLRRQKQKSVERFKVIAAKERIEQEGKRLLKSAGLYAGTRGRRRTVGKGVLKGLAETGDRSAQEALEVYKSRKKSQYY